jgi:tetratricopeptide (TPR) repeat protein
MYRKNLFVHLPCALLLVAIAGTALAENEGQDNLDRATQLKVTAQSMDDLSEVVDQLETALEKGLDEDNTAFAQQLLTATLLQRGTLFSAAVFNVSPQDPQRGMRAMQFRQFALNDLQRAVQIDEKLWDAHLLIGKLQLLPLGDANAARRALSKVADAAEAAPAQQAEALALRSATQKEAEKQLADLDRAVELTPEQPEYLRLRAQSRSAHKKLDEALADIDKALAMETDHAASHELRGMILLGLERYDDALAAFDRASELVPESSLPYQHRGELYIKKGDSEKAIEQLSKALEISPDNFSARLVRASVFFELKQPERALEDVEHAIRIQPQRVEPHLMRAEILAVTERMPEAIAHLEELLQLAPGQIQILSQLGAFYVIDEQPRKAVDAFSRVLEQDSENARALRYRADAYLSIGEHAKAIADFDRVVEDSSEDESVLNNFAWVLATSPDDELRNGKRALELATKAAELTGYEMPHILSTLAAAYAETGDLETAKKWSAKAVELSQKGIESAENDKQRAQLKTQHEQLQKELATYEEGKPVRERQNVEDEDQEPPAADHALTPSAEPAPARTSDF